MICKFRFAILVVVGRRHCRPRSFALRRLLRPADGEKLKRDEEEHYEDGDHDADEVRRRVL